MIVKVPGPATVGSKVPLAGFVMPVPLQVPPGFTADSVTGKLLEQNGPAGLTVASGVVLMVIGKEVGDEGEHPFISE